MSKKLYVYGALIILLLIISIIFYRSKKRCLDITNSDTNQSKKKKNEKHKKKCIDKKKIESKSKCSRDDTKKYQKDTLIESNLDNTDNDGKKEWKLINNINLFKEKQDNYIASLNSKIKT